MKTWFKENLTLFLSALLPVFLVFFLAIMSEFPKWWVTPPEYDVLYMTNVYSHDGVSYEVNNGKLQIWITGEVKTGNLPMPHLYRFNAKTKTSKEILLPIEKVTKAPLTQLSKDYSKTTSNNKEELLVPELKNLQIKTNELSPDGFITRFISPANNGLFGFLSISNRRSFVLSKEGYIQRIIDEGKENNLNHSIKFLGWITEQ